MSADSGNSRLDTIADGIHRFDSHYIRARHTAVYIIVSDGDVALIDCAVTPTVEPLLAALDTLGIERNRVRHLVITHAHMDHAGGAGVLLERLPSARLYAHPAAGKHLVDPTKLEAGVRAVFGDDFFEREYAPLKPVPEERLVETEDGDAVVVGSRELRAVHTPGHAWHHQALWEPETRTLFPGDAFGVGYPELTADDGPFFVPETPPPQFRPEEMHASIDRIVDLEPARVVPTHFEIVTDPAAVADGLHRLVDDTLERCRRAGSPEALEGELLEAYAAELERRGRRPEALDEMRRLYTFDARLSAQGLWVWRQKQER